MYGRVLVGVYPLEMLEVIIYPFERLEWLMAKRFNMKNQVF